MTDETTTVIPLDGCEEQFRDLLTKDVDIPYGRFNYPCRLKLNTEAQYLSVQLHGAVRSRSETVLPVFSRWNWGKILGAHVLSICDPTIYLDDNLSIGWYLGNKEESAMHGVVAIAQRCAAIIGIAPERIVFSGSSGGGFAALQAAALIKNGKAIAINAQTDLLQYTKTLVQSYVNVATEFSTIEEARNAFGNRWNAIESLQSACNSGGTPKIVIVQNKNDGHYRRHYIPFAKFFDLHQQDEQSINGNFMSILYDGPHGHVPEPSEVVKRINNEGVPFLLGETVAPIVPDLFTKITLEAGKIQAKIQTNADNYEFACYLRKDGATVEKQFYSSKNTFSFNIFGPGKYSCMGFIRDKVGEVFTGISTIIHVTEADIPAVKNDNSQ